jgi:hypothetical protein
MQHEKCVAHTSTSVAIGSWHIESVAIGSWHIGIGVLSIVATLLSGFGPCGPGPIGLVTLLLGLLCLLCGLIMFVSGAIKVNRELQKKDKSILAADERR